ncbi:MAG: dienelactone hydrolase family protein [Acidobacteria bacterium]|nr:dienelactone hydrolase family protein [Acidobacteriota bacterium]MCA1609665.1 dienelactone hydrolase family protein [Acidobacteriota bacterium]
MKKRLALLWGLVFLSGYAAARAEKAEVRRETITSGGRERSYWLFVPEGGPTGTPKPLLVLLHGSGRNGETVARPWKDTAAREGIVLAAPDSLDSVHWTSPSDGPGFLRDVVEAVRVRTAIDSRRVFLFGHSAGACFALEVGALESAYFAAVAIHAGALPPDDFATFDWAKRKIPFGMWIGTRDAFFPLDAVRATRDALKSRGFPVEYQEMAGHTHDYYGSSKEINRMAWEFFKARNLDADPQYAPYGESR